MDKLFTGMLVINWKTGKMQIKKRTVKNVGSFDIPIKLEINVKVPDYKEIVAKGEIEIQEAKLNQMVVESI